MDIVSELEDSIKGKGLVHPLFVKSHDEIVELRTQIIELVRTSERNFFLQGYWRN